MQIVSAGKGAGGGGLALLIDRAWRQEVIHQLVLKELFEQTDLARSLGLWRHRQQPTAWYEALGGLFDLALGRSSPEVLIELKVGADLGDHQRQRQRTRALAEGLPRVYLLLGPAFFMALHEPDARNVGVPELAMAIRSSLGTGDSPVAELAREYLARLEADADGWQADHDAASRSGLDLFRLYAEIAAAWPVDVRPTKVTHPGGPDWILNADAWSKASSSGWEAADFYWEIVNGRTRFKVMWTGDPALRLTAREGFRHALEAAAAELNESVGRTRSRAAKHMTALELTADVRHEVLVDGRVSPERSRTLYDRATAVFQRGLALLRPLTPSEAPEPSV